MPAAKAEAQAEAEAEAGAGAEAGARAKADSAQAEHVFRDAPVQGMVQAQRLRVFWIAANTHRIA